MLCLDKFYSTFNLNIMSTLMFSLSAWYNIVWMEKHDTSLWEFPRQKTGKSKQYDTMFCIMLMAVNECSLYHPTSLTTRTIQGNQAWWYICMKETIKQTYSKTRMETRIPHILTAHILTTIIRKWMSYNLNKTHSLNGITGCIQ